MDTKAFFQSLVSEYDDFILKVVPPYADLFWAMFYYLPQDLQPAHCLDLGCGTGNVTQALHQQFPEARITCVDMTPEMLNATAKKVDPVYLNFVESTFEDLMLPHDRFDVVMSSLAIHHLSDEAKATLMQKIYDWLAPGGFFVLADGFRSCTERLHEVDLKLWTEVVLEGGMSEADWAEGIKHREAHDHYATLDNFKQWLTTAGFGGVECVWRYGVWGVLQAQKPPIA